MNEGRGWHMRPDEPSCENFEWAENIPVLGAMEKATETDWERYKKGIGWHLKPRFGAKEVEKP